MTPLNPAKIHLEHVGRARDAWELVTRKGLSRRRVFPLEFQHKHPLGILMVAKNRMVDPVAQEMYPRVVGREELGGTGRSGVDAGSLF